MVWVSVYSVSALCGQAEHHGGEETCPSQGGQEMRERKGQGHIIPFQSTLSDLHPSSQGYFLSSTTCQQHHRLETKPSTNVHLWTSTIPTLTRKRRYHDPQVSQLKPTFDLPALSLLRGCPGPSNDQKKLTNSLYISDLLANYFSQR